MLEPKEIDALIKEAWGERVEVYSYSLEIMAPTGFEVVPDMYFFLGTILRHYGAARAAAERDKTIQTITNQANALPADVDDGFYAGYKLAIRNALAAVRSLD